MRAQRWRVRKDGDWLCGERCEIRVFESREHESGYLIGVYFGEHGRPRIHELDRSKFRWHESYMQSMAKHFRYKKRHVLKKARELFDAIEGRDRR